MQSDRTIHDRMRNVSNASTCFHVETEDHGTLDSHAVIVATGATPVMLNVPGAQEFAGVTILEGYEVVVARGAETQRLSVDAAFVDLGLYANSDFVRGILRTEQNGFIEVNARNETSVTGLFAEGNVTTTMKEQKLIAVGEGVKAAVSAYEYILWRRWADMQ